MVVFGVFHVRPAVCRMLSSLLFLGMVSPASLMATNTQVSFTGAVSTVPAVGLSSPQAGTVDAFGNLFILNGGSGGVIEMPAGGNGQINIPLPGLVGPEGIAVDNAGDLFIADYIGGVALELPAGGGTPVPFAKGLGSPFAVAVDSNGNVFLGYANTGAVLEYPGNGGKPNLTGSPTTLALGLTSPRALAVDSSGDLYIVDAGTKAVYKIPWTGSAWGVQSTLKIQSANPLSICLDAFGDIFIADYVDQSLEELTAGNADISLGSFYDPNAVAADPFGNVYVVSATANDVSDLQFESVNFYGQGTGTSSATGQLKFSIGNLSSPVTVGVLTTGIAGLDFVDAGGSTCASQTYEQPATCVVNVKFTPKAAGLRRGAVVISDSKGEFLSVVSLSGTGIGPQVVFRPGTPTTISSKLVKAPAGFAVDAKGNLFIADAGANAVEEITAASGYKTVTTLAPAYTKGGGFQQPLGIALDGAGNLWVGCGDGSLQVIVASDNYNTAGNLGNVGSPIWGVAVDGREDVFFAVPELNVVGMVNFFYGYGDGYALPAVLSEPLGLALDGAGNLFVSSLVTPAISELSPVDGYMKVKSIPTNLQGPGLVALDAAGDIYLTDSQAGKVEELVAASGYAAINTLASGSDNIAAITVGGEGNVLFGNFQNGTIHNLDFADAPNLAFKATNVDSTSSDSPRVLQLANIGTLDLSLADVVYPADFPEGHVSEPNTLPQIPPNGGICSGPGLVIAGGMCVLPIDFSPQSAGLLTENVTLTDNALNVSDAMQRIEVQGKGLQVAQTITFPMISSQQVGATVSLAATASSGLTVSYASLTTQVCTVKGNTASMIESGTCRIQASQAGDAKYHAAPSVNVSFTVTGLPQTIMFPAISSQTVLSKVNLSATASSSLPVSFASLTPRVCDVTGSTASTLITGTCTIQATQPGNKRYLAASAVSQSFTVTTKAQTITFAAPVNGLAGTKIQLNASSSSGLPVSFTYLTPKQCVLNGNTLYLLNQGKCEVQASQGGNSVYAPATAVQQTIQVLVF